MYIWYEYLSCSKRVCIRRMSFACRSTHHVGKQGLRVGRGYCGPQVVHVMEPCSCPVGCTGDYMMVAISGVVDDGVVHLAC
jgi:hypothetical protein